MQHPGDDVTTSIHRITVEPPQSQSQPQPPRAAAPAGRSLRAVPRSLTATLLPGERVAFGTSPHPFVVIRPLLILLGVLIAFGVAWHLLADRFHLALEIVGALAAAASVASVVRGAGYFLGFRVVATNRRIFVINGILWRRVVPLGNTALAASTLVQGVFGRIYGFGSVDVPQAGTRRALFGDVRDPGELYRECQAVANGVDGETWTPAVRQTIIP